MTGTTPGISSAVRQLRDLSLSGARAAALRAAAELGLADVIGEAPASLADLATAVEADPGALRRLLRALTWQGVFAELADGTYAHTDMSRLLRADTPDTLKDIVLWSTEPWTWELWPHLAKSVRTGKAAFPDLHGDDFFGYLRTEAPESARAMDRAMTQSSHLSERAIVDSLDLSGATKVVDVCGGRGHLLAALTEKYPAVQGVLFDTQEALDNADDRLREGGAAAGRVSLVAGDIRQAIPVEADVYVLKNILEWNDENAVAVLRSVAAAAPPGARIVVIGNVVDASPEVTFTTSVDLMLLLNVGGGRRTMSEFRTLIEKGGLTVESDRAVDAYLALLECRVADRP
ncbi:methyltransferase [Streptomyces acidiscabies]|uniref:Methyltransferase n=1 Tax=Streptomyces acidiscabies TaxID=42234 RepID=A0AAP6EDQ8_9ACTN|nr:methyltransferase [Streptomyces acidiscabies]MBP5939984.1 methyltransferase [Streptomyces sp. LBUM 1476]MBZ3911175.1 methyltransferase [Streptomyces acidiscabies]MDX2959043.1 methyltransferase [Streptomyces acidiscabies]MDX3023891.1 methyltransferase [Streptomyces acidiscabies]MDX3788288.1 methyltransferase [Streptomyces acidiscabies]